MFSAATIRAYAYDLLNFLRFLSGRGSVLAGVVPADLFDYLDWQSSRVPGRAGVWWCGWTDGAVPRRRR